MCRSRHNKKYSLEVIILLLQQRLELLRLVIDEKYSIKAAGDYLGFKRSTAKRVVQDYRKTGKISKRNTLMPNI